MNTEKENLTPNMNIGGMTFAERVSGVLKVMERLDGILSEENKALRQRNFEKVKEVRDDKNRLAEAYAKGFEGLMKYKDAFVSLDAASKEQIKKASYRLDRMMRKNEMLLKAGITASKRVLEIIRNSAADAEQENKGYYSRTGRMGDDGRCHSAFSINQEF